MTFTYHRMIKLLAARNCYESGAKVSDIAKQAGVSRQTIVRWLRQAGVVGALT